MRFLVEDDEPIKVPDDSSGVAGGAPEDPDSSGGSEEGALDPEIQELKKGLDTEDIDLPRDYKKIDPNKIVEYLKGYKNKYTWSDSQLHDLVQAWMYKTAGNKIKFTPKTAQYLVLYIKERGFEPSDAEGTKFAQDDLFNYAYAFLSNQSLPTLEGDYLHSVDLLYKDNYLKQDGNERFSALLNPGLYNQSYADNVYKLDSIKFVNSDSNLKSYKLYAFDENGQPIEGKYIELGTGVKNPPVDSAEATKTNFLFDVIAGDKALIKAFLDAHQQSTDDDEITIGAYVQQQIGTEKMQKLDEVHNCLSKTLDENKNSGLKIPEGVTLDTVQENMDDYFKENGSSPKTVKREILDHVIDELKSKPVAQFLVDKFGGKEDIEDPAVTAEKVMVTLQEYLSSIGITQKEAITEFLTKLATRPRNKKLQDPVLRSIIVAALKDEAPYTLLLRTPMESTKKGDEIKVTQGELAKAIAYAINDNQTLFENALNREVNVAKQMSANRLRTLGIPEETITSELNNPINVATILLRGDNIVKDILKRIRAAGNSSNS